LIAFNYELIDSWAKKEQTLRWHIYFQKTGKVELNIELAPLSSGTVIKASLNDQSVNFTTKKGIKNYRFSLLVQKAGKRTLSLSIDKLSGRQVGKLYGLDVFGAAVEGAKLLRARWRPGAVHAKFTSSTTSDSILWVMTSKSSIGTSSYSPITTPFGYYGTSFDEEKRTKTVMNFSMWSKLNVPQEQMTHLIAVGSKQADFGGFGHEGTGVKLRGDWQPLANRPQVLTQALRVEYSEKYATYYGYFLNENGDWKFFCSGRKWLKSRKDKKALWPGAFVEVPGPPNRQRSGDLYRDVLRQGWVMDSKKQWHFIDQMSQGKAENRNKSWAVNGTWFSMKMGGMEHHTYPQSNILKSSKPEVVPDYLKPEKVRALFKTPVTFGKISAARLEASKANISFDLKDPGPNAQAIIYYGTKDCLTYAPRKLHGTEKKSSVLKDSGIWENSFSPKSIKTGQNSIELKGLKVDQKYWFRILIINDNGRQWSDESIQF